MFKSFEGENIGNNRGPRYEVGIRYAIGEEEFEQLADVSRKELENLKEIAAEEGPQSRLIEGGAKAYVGFANGKPVFWVSSCTQNGSDVEAVAKALERDLYDEDSAETGEAENKRRLVLSLKNGRNGNRRQIERAGGAAKGVSVTRKVSGGRAVRETLPTEADMREARKRSVRRAEETHRSYTPRQGSIVPRHLRRKGKRR